jgi:FAD/FMN-containing dehydrogenase
MVTGELAGKLIRRDGRGYERARRASMWNAFTPSRHPAAIVLAENEQDVCAALRLAAAEGLQVGVRSGGHSWAGNHVREDGLLLDLSRMNSFELDAGAMRATVQPAVKGNELDVALAREGLFFPAGHCEGVGLGGYLLQGGYGWNGRVHGPACMSVEAIELVTAGGELLRADAEENRDLFWAARGSGPGFFGVVTRFHLRLQPRPKVIANAVVTYPIELLEEVFAWAHAIAQDVPRAMELMLFIHRDESDRAEIAVTAPVLMDSEPEARAALELLQSCPALARAKLNVGFLEVTLSDLYAGVHSTYPDEHRYAVDNMWTHAGAAQLAPGLRSIAESLPASPSHMLWMNWGPGSTPAPERPDMAYSVEDDTYIALYGVWQAQEEDQANVTWATEHMREMEELSSGIQLADENLGRRPARFVSDTNLERLDQLRAEHDPDGRFYPWMGRPDRGRA